MKKLHAYLLLAILGISMTGCGGENSSTSTSSNDAPIIAASSALVKAAYVDTDAIGAYAAIPSPGFSAPTIIIFGFADVTTPIMKASLVSSIEKAMFFESPNTKNLISIGGERGTESNFNSAEVNAIVSNVSSQIDSFNSAHSTKIDGVDLDLENGIDSATIASLATAFKSKGYIVSAAPQIFISPGTGFNIDSSNPSNLVLTSGKNALGTGYNVNTYQAALNTGKIDYLFVQAYNSGGFTINNVDESNISFFKNSAQALNNVVRTSCSSTAICIPASTKIVIGSVANKYAGGDFTPFFNNVTAADQQRTLNTLSSDISSMVGNPAFSYFAGTMVWSQNMDYAATLYNAGNTAQTPGAFNATIFGALTIPNFIVKISNNAPNQANPNAYGSVTLVVNGASYQFLNQYNEPITPQQNTQWGTLPSSQSNPDVKYSASLDKFFINGATSFTASDVIVYGYQTNSLNNPSGAYSCRSNRTYTFNAGRSYNIVFNATDNTGNNGTAACTISQVN